VVAEAAAAVLGWTAAAREEDAARGRCWATAGAARAYDILAPCARRDE
jgi:hypothetical protein